MVPVRTLHSLLRKLSSTLTTRENNIRISQGSWHRNFKLKFNVKMSSYEKNFEAADVFVLAEQARLSISNEEALEYGDSLKKIVHWFGQLDEIDVENVPPAIRFGSEIDSADAREDAQVVFTEREFLWSEVPQKEGPFLKVPKILNNENTN